MRRCMSIRKAVIPVAGFGTRFLPASKAVPKNVLPVFDRPSIHFCVEEAARAGIEEVILVVSRNQEAIPRYFEEWPELEATLAGRGNSSAVEEIRHITSLARITCVMQTEQRGLGHAVLMTREAVGDEPFAVFLPDDIIWAERPTIGAMIDVWESTGSFVLAVKRVPDEAIPNLGIVSPEGESVTNHKLVGMVEKPPLEEAPSNLAIIGRYVLGPEIFDTLENVEPGALNEIQLTDAIAAHMESPGVYGHEFSGEHFDVGTPLGMLKASVAAGLRRDDVGGELRDWLTAVLESGS
jgi:UTP--glucose-1-phosphate uridylyltransferase